MSGIDLQKLQKLLNNPDFQQQFNNKWIIIGFNGVVYKCNENLMELIQDNWFSLSETLIMKIEHDEPVNNEKEFAVVSEDNANYHYARVLGLKTCENCYFSMDFETQEELQCLKPFECLLGVEIIDAVTGEKVPLKHVVAEQISACDYTCRSRRNKEKYCGIEGKDWKLKENKNE